MINKLPVCQVEINGKKYRFLIDTGALTIIPREVFDELELAVRYRGMFNDFNNEQPQVKDFVILPSLKINNLEFKDIGAVAFTIENDLMKCLYDGIIGANMVYQFNHQMTLFSSFIFPYISLFTISVSPAMQINHGVI